jgi:hypothetical protein
MHPTSNYWLRIFVFGLVVLCALYLLYYLLFTLKPAPAAAPTSTPISTPTPTVSQPNFTDFVGTWDGHGRRLSFASDGHAQFIGRAYQWCGPGVSPPCDSMQGNFIVGGINETMVFTRVNGSTAYGIVTSSTANNLGQAVSLTLQPNDVIAVYDGTKFANGSILCGPQSPPGWCGA